MGRDTANGVGELEAVLQAVLRDRYPLEVTLPAGVLSHPARFEARYPGLKIRELPGDDEPEAAEALPDLSNLGFVWISNAARDEHHPTSACRFFVGLPKAGVHSTQELVEMGLVGHYVTAADAERFGLCPDPEKEAR